MRKERTRKMEKRQQGNAGEGEWKWVVETMQEELMKTLDTIKKRSLLLYRIIHFFFFSDFRELDAKSLSFSSDFRSRSISRTTA